MIFDRLFIFPQTLSKLRNSSRGRITDQPLIDQMFPVFIPVWINSLFSDSSVTQCDTKWMSCCDTLHLSQKY